MPFITDLPREIAFKEGMHLHASISSAFQQFYPDDYDSDDAEYHDYSEYEDDDDDAVYDDGDYDFYWG